MADIFDGLATIAIPVFALSLHCISMRCPYMPGHPQNFFIHLKTNERTSICKLTKLNPKIDKQRKLFSQFILIFNLFLP